MYVGTTVEWHSRHDRTAVSFQSPDDALTAWQLFAQVPSAFVYELTRLPMFTDTLSMCVDAEADAWHSEQPAGRYAVFVTCFVCRAPSLPEDGGLPWHVVQLASEVPQL